MMMTMIINTIMVMMAICSCMKMLMMVMMFRPPLIGLGGRLVEESNRK